jgi:predicted ester cyclase
MDAAASLTVEQARKIVAPLYDALTEPGKKDTAALLASCAHDDYRSYHTNGDFLTRDQLAGVFVGMGAAVPDLTWKIIDLMVIGDQVIVRGEAAGTPTGEFWGQAPTGKGFKTMAIDIFTIRDGKLAKAFHIENWMTALEQMRK